MSLRGQVQGGEFQAGQEDLGGEKLGTRNSDGVVTANKLARMGYKVNVSCPLCKGSNETVAGRNLEPVATRVPQTTSSLCCVRHSALNPKLFRLDALEANNNREHNKD